jgi:hypothetical protein
MNDQFLNVVKKCNKDKTLEKMNKIDGNLKDKIVSLSHEDGQQQVYIVKSKPGCGHTRKALKKEELESHL